MTSPTQTQREAIARYLGAELVGTLFVQKDKLFEHADRILTLSTPQSPAPDTYSAHCRCGHAHSHHAIGGMACHACDCMEFSEQQAAGAALPEGPRQDILKRLDLLMDFIDGSRKLLSEGITEAGPNLTLGNCDNAHIHLVKIKKALVSIPPKAEGLPEGLLEATARVVKAYQDWGGDPNEDDEMTVLCDALLRLEKALATPPAVPAPAQGEADDDAEMLQVIEERDQAQEWADKLAYAVAPMEEIGEHSNQNNPWANALEILEAQEGSKPSAAPLRWTKEKPKEPGDYLAGRGEVARRITFSFVAGKLKDQDGWAPEEWMENWSWFGPIPKIPRHTEPTPSPGERGDG